MTYIWFDYAIKWLCESIDAEAGVMLPISEKKNGLKTTTIPTNKKYIFIC
jgi:hypothetical protein